MSEKINNKLRGVVKPKTLNEVRAYQAQTGMKTSALVRTAVEQFMERVNNKGATSNRL